MTKSVGALFDRFEDAQGAVDELIKRGFNSSDISLIATNAATNYAQFVNVANAQRIEITDANADAVSAEEGAGFGAVVGAVTGVLAGLAAITIPGIGAIVALGPVVGALTGGTVGAVTGAAVGGIVAAMVKSGFSEEEAQRYAEGVRRGSALVIVQATDGKSFLAQDIMRDFHAVDIAQRSLEWETAGWKGFDENAPPYQAQAQSAASTTSTAPTIPEPLSDGSLDDTARHRVSAAERSNANTTAAPRASQAQPLSTMMGESEPHHWINGSSQADFDTYDMDFRKHYATHYGKTGYAYDLYLPSYRYGYELGFDPRYNSLLWSEVEPYARKDWTERYPEGDWDSFSEAVHHAWQQVRAIRVP
ncbi:MAG: hypothetical protein U0528_16755 [Anaerolineae bacterium]